MTSGASLHIWNDQGASPTKIITTQPYQTATSSGRVSLTDNETFNDPINGLEITQNSHDQNSLTFEVNFYTPTKSSPPGGSISGFDKILRIQQAILNFNFFDTDGDLTKAEIYLQRTDRRPIPYCPFPTEWLCGFGTVLLQGSDQSFTINLGGLRAGTYEIYIQVYDDQDNKCSGLPQTTISEWSDCGENDFFTLKVL